MMPLTPDETTVLRVTFGLHATQRRAASRNVLHPVYVKRYASAVASLIEQEMMTFKLIDGKTVHKGTRAGFEAVRDQPWI